MRNDEDDYGVEAWAAEVFGWRREDESYYDLVRPGGVPVEAKGCLRWQSNGSKDKKTRGRFRLWARSHDELVNDCGEYLFVVYEEKDWEQPWAWRTLDAIDVGMLVGQFNNHTYRPSKGDTVKVRWPDIIEATTEVERWP